MKHNTLSRNMFNAVAAVLFFIGAIAPVVNQVIFKATSQHQIINSDDRANTAEFELIDGGNSGGAGTCSGSNC